MSEGERYRLIRRIGQGGMAEVYEAEVVRPGFSRRVAVKRLLVEHRDDPELAAGFEDEAKVIGQLQHPGIIGILDFGELDGAPFQVLELVDGPSLLGLEERARAEGIPVSPEVWLAVGAEVALALDFAHRALDSKHRALGVVHRDVSPSNILLSSNGDVKLGDFGIAIFRERRAKTSAGVVKGQLPFMAPEQLMGRAIDGRADVFALGCVLHRMIAGHSPLETQEARTKLLADREITLSPQLDPELAAVLAWACHPDPAQRLATAGALHSALLGLLDRRGVRDSRSLLRQIAERLRAPPPPAKGLLELMDVELVLDEGPAPIRRYSTIQRPPSDRPQITRPVGGVLADYVLEGRLGAGGFAEVWRARHLVTGALVALKVMHAALVGSATARRRFERELVALQTVVHPSLVEIYGSGFTDDGRPFLAMELLDGPTLRDWVKARGKLPLQEAVEIARDTAAALAVLHAAQVVHRDLKPSNLILVKGRPKIVDFGLAVLLDPGSELTRFTSVERVIGTPRWMAPEQILDPSRVGPAADLYGIGLLLYWMITGQHPFTGDRAELLSQHLESRPAPAEGAGPVQPILERLLSKHPEQRPTAAELIEALEALNIEPVDESGGATVAVVPVIDDDSTSDSTGPALTGVVEPTQLAPTRSTARPSAALPWRWISAATVLSVLASALVTVALQPPPEEIVDRVVEPVAPPEPTPIVEARPEVAPPIEVSPIEDLPTPKPEPSKTRPRKDPVPVDDRDQQVASMLSARGLSRRDLPLLPALSEATGKVARATTSAERAASLDELKAAITGAAITSGQLTARLEQFRDALKAHADAHPDSEVRTIEAGYLDVRSAAPKAESFEARLALLRRLAELQAQLDR